MSIKDRLRDLDYLKSIINDLCDRGMELPSNFPLSQVIKDMNTYKFSKPRKVQIPKSDGKSMRDIFVYNEEDSFFLKIINKILYDECSNLISDSVYSYKRGVRTFNAAKVVRNGLRTNKLFGAKLDISNYFLSVSKQALLNSILEISKDSEETFKFFFNMFNIGNEEFMGILPGSAVSAFFANVLLKDLDDWIDSNSLVYARYADDMVVFTETQDELENLLNEINDRLSNYGLKLNPNKIKRFDMNKPIDFLGLRITKSEIDISKSTFSNLKKFIKKTCKKYRNLIHLDRSLDVEEGTEKCINKLQRLMYRSLQMKGNEHAGSRMSYVLGSVTTDNTLKLIDYYICDCLNDMRLNCHNKSPKRLSLGEFRKYGLVSVVKVWNLYKMNGQVCRLFTQSIYKPKLSYRSNNKTTMVRGTMTFNKELSVRSLKELLGLLTPYSQILVDSLCYDVSNLIVDFKTMEICLVEDFKNLSKRKVIIKDGNVKVDDIILINPNDFSIFRVDLSNLKFNAVSDEELIKSFHESLMNPNLEYNPKFARWNCFGELKSIYDLECNYGIKIDDCNTDLEIRTLKFYFNLYNYLINRSEVLDKSYFIIDNDKIPFILIKELL